MDKVNVAVNVAVKAPMKYDAVHQPALALHSRYGFGRFQVWTSAADYVFRDALLPGVVRVAASEFAGLAGQALAQAFFIRGFVRAAYGAALPVAAAPRSRDDHVFWQFPCRTEGAAWEMHTALRQPVHAVLPQPVRLTQSGDGVLHVYVGLPWATWIDKARKSAWGPLGPVAMQYQLQLLRLRLSGLRQALAALGLGLRLHTVCQHIYWQDLLAVWQRLGLTDVWLSHCPQAGDRAAMAAAASLALHPWSLFAVNVEDPQRRAGLVLGRDPAARSVLASFVGAHAQHYLSDIRLRLQSLAGLAGFVVQLTGQWHFEDVVYQHQIAGAPLSGGADASVASYNSLLSDSVFALCPAGAGANTLRLWEALAVGAIPVLLGPPPVLPCGGSLPGLDWERIVLRVPDAQLAQLPQLLQAMPLAERRQRQQWGMQAYAQVKAQRCF